MTVAFWLATGQTVVFLALCGFGWWLSGRQLRTETNSELAVEHALAAAQYANRAALDSRQMLDVLSEWWEARTDPDPETQPMKRIGTDTVETERVIDDEWLAAARARWDEIAAEPVEKPTARSRTRKRASPPPPAPSPEPFHPTTLSQGPGQ